MFNELPSWYDSWRATNPREVQQEQEAAHESWWDSCADLADMMQDELYDY